MESTGIRIQGKYRDIMKGPDNNIILDTGWRSNMIVHGCKLLIALMMSNKNPQGIQYIRFGAGQKVWDGLWNTNNAPYPKEDTLQLEDPTDFRKEFAKNEIQITSVNEIINQDGSKTYTPATGITNLLRVTVTLEPGFPKPQGTNRSYELREFGLFGQNAADGKPYMINCVRHQLIDKDVENALVREIILTF